MNQVIFLFLRRMRAPLLVLISAYAIAIFGLVMIPGVDDQGQPWRMDFMHAFYFASYMATTIGFGEVPYEFTPAQRMWVIFCIYLTVSAWLYAFGKIITLVQDPSFRQAVTEHAFARSVRNIHEPFYLICGYGDTGSLLVRAMTQRGMRCVVVDRAIERINELEVNDLDIHVPGLCADASQSLTMKEAGLLSRHCAGVVALTDDDHVNLKIAITTKLLHPGIQVICRAEHHDAQDNMASFGTDHIINPYDTFATRLAMALHSPGTHLLHEWLTAVPGSPLPGPLYPPHGTWVLCGYGRLGKAIRERLEAAGIPSVIVEANPDATGCEEFCVIGRGTEAETLRAAGVEKAVGIVAGTDDDANNLSVVMTAAQLNPDLFMVARQNKCDNDDVFQAALLDLVMQRSEMIAREIIALLTTPLLNTFLNLIKDRDNDWANEKISRLSAVVGERVPDSWYLRIDEMHAPELHRMLEEGGVFTLGMIMRDYRDCEQNLPAVALMLRRRQGGILLFPDDTVELHHEDQLLFAGEDGCAEHMRWMLANHNALHYVYHGRIAASGWLWRWLRAE